jgi:hypothetical protein
MKKVSGGSAAQSLLQQRIITARRKPVKVED